MVAWIRVERQQCREVTVMGCASEDESGVKPTGSALPWEHFCLSAMTLGELLNVLTVQFFWGLD